MSARYLLDTNVVSELAKPRPDAALKRRLTDASSVVAIGAPAWQELQYGVDRLPPSQRRATLATWLVGLEAELPILPYDASAAAWHGHERARLEAKGKTAPFVDGQIVAIAVTRGLTLVTRNVRDFAAFEGVTVERW
jgi:tRNA(fMet)-specific endonuclease VapC